jgi:L-ribulokinase
MIGLEAGQSAFGDAYAWFKRLLLWPAENVLAQSNLLTDAQKQAIINEMADNIIPELSSRAEQLPLSEADEIAIDWLNGRRTPDANQMLTAAFAGLDLGSDAVRLFRAVAEATCFGAKAIVDRFRAHNIPVHGLIGLGGVARKSPFIMQMMANVMDMPIRIHQSDQTCALGAAMFAATVAGIYPNVQAAMQHMGPGFDKVYYPQQDKVPVYALRYQKYLKLGAFTEAL